MMEQRQQPDGEDERAGNGAARRLLHDVPRYFAGLLLLAGVAVNFANVIGRYLFGSAIFWAEEIMVFLLIWGVFVGAVAVAWRGGHLRMDLFSTRLETPWREAVNALTVIAFIGCSVFVAIQSWGVTMLFARSGQVSVTAGVPMTVPHAALLLGFVAMVIAVLVRLRAYLSGRF